MRACIKLSWVFVLWFAVFVPVMAYAQTPSNSSPNSLQAIVLNVRPGPAALPEQWEDFHGQQIVRNVTTSTLTPVLPESGRATGASVIVAPGGAFMFVSIDNEGFKVARWLADHGIAAFVLKYRTRETPRDTAGFGTALGAMMKTAAVGSDPDHLLATPKEVSEDALAAIRLVRARAKAWEVDPTRVGFLGFSAGAITALSVGLADDAAARPDFIGAIYGTLEARTVPSDAPPLFIAVALDDPLMAQGKPLDLLASWRSAHRPIEAHFYERGSHGFGMSGSHPASALWIDEFHAWMADRGLLKAH